MFAKLIPQGYSCQTPGVTRVSIVALLIHLPARHTDLVCIDYDDEITAVQVGGVNRLVLPPEDRCDSRGQSTQRLAFCIHEIPLAFDVFCSARKSPHSKTPSG